MTGRRRLEAGGEDGARAMVALQEVSAADPSGERAPSTARLVGELQVAAVEASTDGFYRMARLLEECSLALDSRLLHTRSDEVRLMQRARQSLDLWVALREW